jgi:hypothetical protein
MAVSMNALQHLQVFEDGQTSMVADVEILWQNEGDGSLQMGGLQTQDSSYLYTHNYIFFTCTSSRALVLIM